VCKDCPDETVPSKRRPAPHPGPRCATHHRERKRTVSARAHERRLVAQFGLTAEEYAALYEAQGGRCYVCRKATGAARRLAVEHDHGLARLHDHPDDQACRKCVRGLACGWCNYDVLGRLGDDPATFERIASALRCPPARRLFTALSPACGE
jgi:hypothetical protein